MVQSGVRIRSARVEDAPALTILSAQLGYPCDPDDVSRRLAELMHRPDHAVYVAETGGHVIGWVHVHERQFLYTPPFGEIGGIVVDEAYRKSGAGKLLMAECEGWAVRSGLAEIRLRSGEIRSEAHEFYQKIGYENVKSQKVFRRPLD
ncbi:GNAT family N-acetyltransferase [Melghirimyces profundicolus]|nr:GNAT family N-acetyltransferase [Melghirimyces profundicolus]